MTLKEWLQVTNITGKEEFTIDLVNIKQLNLHQFSLFMDEELLEVQIRKTNEFIYINLFTVKNFNNVIKRKN